MPSQRILVIEDSRTQAREIEYHLRKAGYDVEVAFNGIAGLSRASGSQFDLVLTDVLMPSLTGAGSGECRDDDTGHHVQRMSRYCALLASRIGFDRDRCELIRFANILHDVGKIGIEDRILLKPGSLTPDEFRAMKNYVLIVYKILAGSDSELLQLAGLIALNSTKNMTDRVIQRGLSGDAISIEGRAAAIADVFDALSSDRVYRRLNFYLKCTSSR